ncbi:hypothetical protein N9895_02090, partial [Gammaproteobacteria bacterium]|nr:hypothetical protein [Gammaproteobacteria bacterium]
VGSECLILWLGDTCSELEKCTISFLIDGVGVVCLGGKHHSFDTTARATNRAEFKPIYNRTPKQKAVDNAYAEVHECLPSCATVEGRRVQDEYVKIVINALFDAKLLKDAE